MQNHQRLFYCQRKENRKQFEYLLAIQGYQFPDSTVAVQMDEEWVSQTFQIISCLTKHLEIVASWKSEQLKRQIKKKKKLNENGWKKWWEGVATDVGSVLLISLEATKRGREGKRQVFIFMWKQE